MADRVGQQLGNYRLVRLLGEGGFAEVYLGEHLYLQTQAAIKVLHTRLTQDDLAGFLGEARTIANLKHPHIVRVLDFGVEGSIPFLVMDYAPNGTLRARYPKGVPLALEVILLHVQQVADALQYAHEHRLIHRDIKPENMLLGPNNEIFLSDFGIATVAQSSRSQGTQEVAGTVAYMAPEQLQGKPRPASDQYSLAVVVYEWLAGVRPFQGSFSEIASQHLFVPPPPLREKAPGISPLVEAAILTALAKDPQERFASVQIFTKALEEASRSRQRVQPDTFRASAPPAAVQDSIAPTLFARPAEMVSPGGPATIRGPVNPPPGAYHAPLPNPPLPTQLSPAPEKPSVSPSAPEKGLQKKFPGLAALISTILLVVIISGILFIHAQGSPGTGGNSSSSSQCTIGGTSFDLSTFHLVTAGALTVASDTTYPPQEYQDPNNQGTYIGVDLDLIREIGKRMCLGNTVIQPTNFDNIITGLTTPALGHQRYDLSISAFSITADRLQMVDMVPYFQAGESLLVAKGNPESIQSLNDLCGKTVAVETGTVELDELNAKNAAGGACTSKNINILSFTSQEVVVSQLLNGRAVATYQDSPVTDYYAFENAGKAQAGPLTVALAPEGIVMRKDNPQLELAVKKALCAMQQEGKYTSILTQWGQQSEALPAGQFVCS